MAETGALGGFCVLCCALRLHRRFTRDACRAGPCSPTRRWTPLPAQSCSAMHDSAAGIHGRLDSSLQAGLSSLHMTSLPPAVRGLHRLPGPALMGLIPCTPARSTRQGRNAHWHAGAEERGRTNGSGICGPSRGAADRYFRNDLDNQLSCSADIRNPPGRAWVPGDHIWINCHACRAPARRVGQRTAQSSSHGPCQPRAVSTTGLSGPPSREHTALRSPELGSAPPRHDRVPVNHPHPDLAMVALFARWSCALPGDDTDKGPARCRKRLSLFNATLRLEEVG